MEDEVEVPEPLDIDATVEGIVEDLRLVEAPEEPEAPEASEPEAPAELEPAPVEEPPPDTWTKASQEKWATIAPELRQEIRKRESDISKYVGETKASVGVAKAFEKVIEPYTGMFEKMGIDPWKHTAALLQAHATMNWGSPQQKLQAFAALAQGAGIDLRAFAAGDAAGAAQNPAFQRIQALEGEIRRLAQGVTGVTSTIQAARAAELETGVLAFAQDEVAHPFFWEVTGEIQGFLEKGAASTLQQAYDLAVLANPVTRQKVFEAEAAKRAQNLASLEKARVAKAQKAASANVRSSGKGRAASVLGSIDDTLADAMASINSRTH